MHEDRRRRIMECLGDPVESIQRRLMRMRRRCGLNEVIQLSKEISVADSGTDGIEIDEYAAVVIRVSKASALQDRFLPFVHVAVKVGVVHGRAGDNGTP